NGVHTAPEQSPFMPFGHKKRGAIYEIELDKARYNV
ncbi:hypothetical protein WI7_04700, partial [Escherichia coli KTE105]